MPKPNIIQFSLNIAERKKLEQYANDGESLGLAAKRVIMAVLTHELDIPEPEPEPIAISPKLLAELQDRIAALEKNMAAPQETAIMVQKKPSVPLEIALDHDQAAKEWQRTTATVKRWASNPDKWPPGWIFDADKQFWVKNA